MSKIIKKVLLIGSIITFLSCEKEANVKIPKTDPKLVVNCLLEPSKSSIKVYVKNSKPMYGSSTVKEDDPVLGANVTLSNGSNSISLPYDVGSRAYTINTSTFSIAPGGTYQLQVVSPDGRTVTSETTIPTYIPADLDVVVENNELVKIKWTDKGNENNYYRLDIKTATANNGNDTVRNPLTEDIYFLNDVNKDGLLIQDEFTIPKNGTVPPIYEAIETLFINCNKDYYLYHQSLKRLNESGGNPFSEPVLVYSNIKNGLGVFAACLRLKKVTVY